MIKLKQSNVIDESLYLRARKKIPDSVINEFTWNTCRNMIVFNITPLPFDKAQQLKTHIKYDTIKRNNTIWK